MLPRFAPPSERSSLHHLIAFLQAHRLRVESSASGTKSRVLVLMLVGGRVRVSELSGRGSQLPRWHLDLN